jgi:ribosomal protein L3 glutamine methyltransferase
MDDKHLYDLKTIRDWLRYCVSQFYLYDVFLGHGDNDPWQEARRLVLRTLHLPVNTGDDILDARLIPQEKDELAKRIQLRCVDKMPTAYILGEAEFAGIMFKVSTDTLVPRSPFAELILGHFANVCRLPPNPIILDMCTGSGCIGIASALHLDAEQVDLVDISTSALLVAQENVDIYDLEDRVNVIQSDLFSRLSEFQRYDLILSNPPYVDAFDMSTLPAEYLHEPSLGLAAGEDGLDLVHTILAEAGKYLSDEGYLIVEVGNSWPALANAYPDVAFEWLSFERGGHGVFALSAAELKAHFGPVA